MTRQRAPVSWWPHCHYPHLTVSSRVVGVETYVRITFSSGSNLRDIANSITEVPEDWVQLPECCPLQPVGPLHVRQSPRQCGSTFETVTALVWEPCRKATVTASVWEPCRKATVTASVWEPCRKTTITASVWQPCRKGTATASVWEPCRKRQLKRRYGSPVAA